MAALTPQEKSKVRYHLGYLGVSSAASLQFGIPRPLQTIFLLETAMNNLIDDGATIEKVREIIGVMDGIECKMKQGQDFLAANRAGNVEIRKEHIEQLEDEYYRWAGRLADWCGVTRYPYAERNRRMLGYGSIPVRH